MFRVWPLIMAAMLLSRAAAAPSPSTVEKSKTVEGWESLIKLARLMKRDGVPEGTRIFNGTRDLEAQKAAARKEGVFIDPQRLQAPLPPPEENAGPIYAKMAALLKEKPLGAGADAALRIKTGVRPSPEQIAALRAVLLERKDLLDLAHEAASRERCVFERDWSDGLLLFPEHTSIRQASRLLRGESLLLAFEGHYSEAVVNQALGFRLAAHADSDPIVIGSLVAVAVNETARSGMQEILDLAGPDAEVVRQVRAAALSSPYHPGLRRTLAGEAGWIVASLQQWREGGPAYAVAVSSPPADGPPVSATPLTREEQRVWNLLVDAFGADYVRAVRRAASTLDLPYPVRKRTLEAMDRETDRFDLTVLFRVPMFPVFAQLNDSFARRRANEAVFLTSTAVLDYRAQHGHYPASLLQTLAGPAHDPFTGRPLLYRRDGDGFIVYSRGRDGTFDGHPSARPDAYREIFFRYPEPAPR